MGKPTGDEVARHYLAGHERLAELVSTLSADQLAVDVTATPGWSVRDIVAHLAAIPTDALAGRITGIPSDDLTRDQVEERRERTVDELLAEWAANVPVMADAARAGIAPANLAVDVLTHEQDIRGALGLPPMLSPDELRFCLDLYAYGLRRRVVGAGLRALAVTAEDTDFRTVAGEGEPAATLRTTEFELFRALSGRRSRGQAAAYGWEGDPAPYLDCLNVFGSLPEVDVDGG